MFAENHATEAVPENELISGLRIAQISVGVAITLPAFLVSAQLFAALGFVGGLIALAWTGLVLFCLGSLTIVAAARTRRSTYSIVSSVFGGGVAIFVNVLLAIVMLGWFAITISIFADALGGSIEGLAGAAAPEWLLKSLGGGVMTLLTLYGFRAIDNLARLVVPLLAIVLLAAFVQTISGADVDELLRTHGDRQQIATIGAGVSIMVGAFVAGVTIAPDIARFVRTPAQGVVASAMGYGVGAQLIFLLAGIPVLVTGEMDFVANLTAIGFGWPALFVVIFATITTNINNLYSVSLSFRQAAARLKDYQVTAAAGGVGTAIALAGIEDVFIPFLLFLGVAVPPIAGVYVVHVLSLGGLSGDAEGRAIYWNALGSWLLGSAVAFASTQAWISLSGAPAIDGVLVSAVTYYLAHKLVAGAKLS